MNFSNNKLKNIFELLKNLSGDSVWHKESEKTVSALSLRPTAIQ